MDYAPRLSLLTADLDTQQKAAAAIARAVANDSALTEGGLPEFRRRGFGRFIKSGDVLLSTDDGIVDAGFSAALLALVRGQSLIGQLTGVTRVPLTMMARLVITTITGTAVPETGAKPIARLAFDVGGLPAKTVAQVVVSSELLRSVDPASQTAIRDLLVSAVAAAEDDLLVAALTAAPAAASAAPGDLLALISDGNPARPYLVGGFDSLLALPPGTLRDLQALGVPVVSSAAAAGRIIAVDATGVLIGDGAIVVETARHASMDLDLGGSPSSAIMTSLWQTNSACLRAESYLRIAVRPGAAAWATA